MRVLSTMVRGRSFGSDSVGIIGDAEVDTCEDLLGRGRGRGCVLSSHKHANTQSISKEMAMIWVRNVR